MKTASLKVSGMTCGHCRATVEKALRDQPGVRKATVDLEQGAAEIEYDEAAVAVEQLIAAVTDKGYRATATG